MHPLIWNNLIRITSTAGRLSRDKPSILTSDYQHYDPSCYTVTINDWNYHNGGPPHLSDFVVTTMLVITILIISVLPSSLLQHHYRNRYFNTALDQFVILGLEFETAFEHLPTSLDRPQCGYVGLENWKGGMWSSQVGSLAIRDNG